MVNLMILTYFLIKYFNQMEPKAEIAKNLFSQSKHFLLLITMRVRLKWRWMKPYSINFSPIH